MMLITRPTMLKIDRYLVSGVSRDTYQQATMRAIRLLADQVHAELVAELYADYPLVYVTGPDERGAIPSVRHAEIEVHVTGQHRNAGGSVRATEGEGVAAGR